MALLTDPRKSWFSLLLAASVATLVLVAGFGDAIGQAVFNLTGNVQHWISPAYSNPFQTADDLLAAAAPTLGGRIERIVTTATPGFQFWDGQLGNGSPKNFPLEVGEGYVIIPSVDEMVVLPGSHTPAMIPQGQRALPAVPQLGMPPGGSLPAGIEAGHNYLIAIPWTTTMTDAEDLRTSIPDCSVVIRQEQRPGQPPSYFFWTGTTGNGAPENFSLDYHQAYLMRTTTDSAGTVLP